MKNKKIILVISLIHILLATQLILSQNTQTDISPSNPHAASVRITMIYPDGGAGFCSGSIIESDTTTGKGKILTAGHCFQANLNQIQQHYQFNQQFSWPFKQVTPPPNYGSDPNSIRYMIDFGPGTRPIQARYIAHEFDPDPYFGRKDIGLLEVPIDINDPPDDVDIVAQSFVVNVNDNIYNIGYPGGNPESIVGAKITSLIYQQKGAGFSTINFPPREGRSGGGIFYPEAGTGEVYKKGKLIGVMTNLDSVSQGGVYANHQQIYDFFNRYGILTV